MKNTILLLVLFLFRFLTAHTQTIITISANQADRLEAIAGNDTVISPGESVSLGASHSALGGTEPYSYSWDDGSSDISTESNPSVNPSATITYTLFVIDKQTCTATDSITISIISTGINDFTENELKIYPNPATDMFTIDYHGENCTISLLDEQGKYLWRKPINGKTSFSAPGTSGNYILKINASGKEIVKKIIVSK
jgi:hypothetical protein